MGRYISNLKDEIKKSGYDCFDLFDYHGLEYSGYKMTQQVHCPGLHGADRKKSGRLHEEDGGFYCFGCARNYDIFALEMAIDGCSFPEAVRNIAVYFGVKAPYGVDEEEDVDDDDDDEHFDHLVRAKKLELKDICRKATDEPRSLVKADRSKSRLDADLEYLSERAIKSRRLFTLAEYDSFWMVFDEIRWQLHKGGLTQETARPHVDLLHQKLAAMIAAKSASPARGERDEVEHGE